VPWIVVWPVLVLGALVGAFFLGRDLWRRVRRFGHAAAAASAAGARSSARADELAAEVSARHPVPAVALLRDPGEIRTDVAAARAVHDRRVEARRARHRIVWTRWREVWR
jgi:hypothetical protein